MPNENKTPILTIVRHGQTNSNTERIADGWMDTPLNEPGLAQAKATGKALKDVKFHHAISSDLPRANQTCRLILEENESSDIYAENIIMNKLLRERSYGIFEGKSCEVVAEFREKYGIDSAPKNGESSADVDSRAREFLKSLGGKGKDNESMESILVVSHGGLMSKMFLVIFNEMNCEISFNIKNAPDFKVNEIPCIENTSISRFEIDLCSEDHTIKTIKCIQLCNIDHLNEMS